MPKIESSAVSTDSFVGNCVIITSGKASFGNPAEGKLTDDGGNIQYIRIQPMEKDDVFSVGNEVVIIKKEGNVFFGSLYDI